MHQTTVRFGPDLWGEIAIEAERAGVSVAQYVRDAALMRVSYTRGRDGDPHYKAALELAAMAQADLVTSKSAETRRQLRHTLEDAAALAAQNRQAMRHSRELLSDAADRGDRNQDERQTKDQADGTEVPVADRP